MEDSMKVAAIEFFDAGHRIGLVVERNGVRRAVKVDNPFSPELEAAWQAKQREVASNG